MTDKPETEVEAGKSEPAPTSPEGAAVDAAVPSREPAVEPAEAVEPDPLEEAVRERDAYLGLAQRTQADFDNFRKRSGRDVAGAEARGVTRLARELLPALDHLEMALAAAVAEAGEDSSLVQGIELVRNDLVAGLARVGIEPFSPQGERFDPTEHEAMAQAPFEGVETGMVAEVYQRGYRANGTVLRPARVVVAQ